MPADGNVNGIVALPAIANLRDLGGHPAQGGRRVRTGIAYRSAELGSPTGRRVLTELGIRTVVDLRTAHERALRPDRLPASVRLVEVDVLEDAAAGTSPADLMAVFRDPAAAEAALGGGVAERLFVDKYREFVTLESARRAYRQLFVNLATTRDGATLLHCTTGKDRTGWAAAALLLLLGVPEAVVEADYLASNAAMRAISASMLAQLAASGVDPALVEPFVIVRREYLAAAFTEMRRTFGSIESYFEHGLSIDTETRGALVARLVTRS